jgi:hypothetical protein
MQRFRLVLSLTISLLLASTAYAGPITGTVSDWPESSTFSFGDGTHDISIFWSTRHMAGGDGWFYGTGSGDSTADFYIYRSFTDPTSVSDASLFTYSRFPDWAAVGDTVFFQSLAGYYGALVLEEIYPNPAGAVFPYTFLNGTWYFQPDGSGDFTGGEPTPDLASSLLLLGMGIAGLRAFGKRRHD